MLTDDDLSLQLRKALQHNASEFSYDRPLPRVRRPAAPVLLAVPTLAAAGIVGVLALPSEAPSGAPTATAPVPTTTSSAPELVTVSTTIGGVRLTYQRPADAEEPFRADFADTTVPSDARELTVDGAARAWIGTDPATGETAAWLTSPVRNGGQTFALLAPDLTQDQLAAIVLGE